MSLQSIVSVGAAMFEQVTRPLGHKWLFELGTLSKLSQSIAFLEKWD